MSVQPAHPTPYSWWLVWSDVVCKLFSKKANPTCFAPYQHPADDESDTKLSSSVINRTKYAPIIASDNKRVVVSLHKSEESHDKPADTPKGNASASTHSPGTSVVFCFLCSLLQLSLALLNRHIQKQKALAASAPWNSLGATRAAGDLVSTLDHKGQSFPLLGPSHQRSIALRYFASQLCLRITAGPGFVLTNVK